MPNHIKQALIISVTILVSPLVVFAQWTPAPGSPPSGNVPAPLNVGNLAQFKEGGLLLNTGGAVNGLIVQFGNVGIGTTIVGTTERKTVN